MLQFLYQLQNVILNAAMVCVVMVVARNSDPALMGDTSLCVMLLNRGYREYVSCGLVLGFEVDQVTICDDGDVRLVGGTHATQGRAEVCYNNVWGTICNSRFGTNEAKVICNQLGFPIGKYVAAQV